MNQGKFPCVKRHHVRLKSGGPIDLAPQAPEPRAYLSLGNFGWGFVVSMCFLVFWFLPVFKENYQAEY